MQLRRSQRQSKPKTIWEQKGAPSAASDPKVTRKAARTVDKTALKPVATGTFPKDCGGLNLKKHSLPELPDYTPPLNLQFQPSISLYAGLTELQIFQQLITPDIISRIVAATNSHAERVRGADPIFSDPDSCIRRWKPVNATDIWRFIGVLLYMGAHIEKRHEDHWQRNKNLTNIMSLEQWEQIHRYFTLRDRSIHPFEEGESWAWSVEPIATIIRQNCKAAWSLSSHLAIDESMTPYCGRTHHKVKLLNKLIKEGYKVWVLRDGGYVWDFLWHSRVDGPETISEHDLDFEQDESETIHLAPTFTLVIRLAQRFREAYPDRVFCFFLDNLFLNLNVTELLLNLRIYCTGTTRKNAQGVPEWLLKLKKQNNALI
jgi:Transposase IS4